MEAMTFLRRIHQYAVVGRASDAVHRCTAKLRATGRLTTLALSKIWSLIWRSGVLAALVVVALILMAMAQLGVYAIAWTMIGPTDDYVTNRWLSMVFPAAIGIFIGILVAWRNWRTHRARTLNGVENSVRSTAGALAAYIEVYMGIAAVRLVLDSTVQAANENIPGGLTPEAIQPYFHVSLTEALLLASGIYATVEITRRACLMRQPSVQTAWSQSKEEAMQSVENLKRAFAGSLTAKEIRQRSYSRAQRRIDSVWDSQRKPRKRLGKL